MALLISPHDYLGRLLCLKPVYGWGWRGENDAAGVDWSAIYAAGHCYIRVDRFFSWRNEIRGIVGQVEEPNHPFHKLWVVGATMLKGDYDLLENLCTRYDLEIGVEEPNNEEWPCIPKSKRKYEGYGILAQSAQHMENFLKR